MCELSELRELSLERAGHAIGDSGSRKICVISVVCVVRVPPEESVRLMRLTGFLRVLWCAARALPRSLDGSHTLLSDTNLAALAAKSFVS